MRSDVTVKSAEGVSPSSPGGISALGFLPLWGNREFYFRVRSLPGVNPNPPPPALVPILDSTAYPPRAPAAVEPSTRRSACSPTSRPRASATSACGGGVGARASKAAGEAAPRAAACRRSSSSGARSISGTESAARDAYGYDNKRK